MTRNEQRIGKAGEEWVVPALRGLGVEMVQPIATPIHKIPTKLPGAFRVIYADPVLGDFTGILPGGRFVLAECKTILERNLQWSDLRPHQPGGLSRHAELGGVSLLVWVHSTGIYVMRWPVAGFGPGKSISPEAADKLSIKEII
jgi:hypothetical protein